jgi:hypothetical protein
MERELAHIVPMRSLPKTLFPTFQLSSYAAEEFQWGYPLHGFSLNSSKCLQNSYKEEELLIPIPGILCSNNKNEEK